MKLDLSYTGILSRVKNFDIYVKGGDGMSEKQTRAFDLLISNRERALAYSICQEGQDLPIPPEDIFISPDDQKEAFEEEFNCKVQFRIKPGHFLIAIIPND